MYRQRSSQGDNGADAMPSSWRANHLYTCASQLPIPLAGGRCRLNAEGLWLSIASTRKRLFALQRRTGLGNAAKGSVCRKSIHIPPPSISWHGKSCLARTLQQRQPRVSKNPAAIQPNNPSVKERKRRRKDKHLHQTEKDCIA